jgi:hypothetical protein
MSNLLSKFVLRFCSWAVRQPHTGFHTRGTLQTHACEHGNPAPVQTGMGFCGYGCRLAKICLWVTRAHH